MTLEVAADPLHLQPNVVLYEMTTPELIACYLYTRQRRRDLLADELEMLSYRLQGEAAIRGQVGPDAQRFIDRLHERIAAHRAPEFGDRDGFDPDAIARQAAAIAALYPAGRTPERHSSVRSEGLDGN